MKIKIESISDNLYLFNNDLGQQLIQTFAKAQGLDIIYKQKGKDILQSIELK